MPTVARNTVFKVDNSSAVLTDISAKVADVKLSRQADILDATTFQQGNAKVYAAGVLGGQIQITFNWDNTIDAHMTGVLGQDTPTLNFEYGPQGSTVGNTKYTGTVILIKYDPPATVNQVIKGQATFQLAGAVTRTTY